MLRQYLINLYLDYVNNWLTLDKFAEFHEITRGEAHIIIEIGKKYHEEYVRIINEGRN